MLNSILQQNPRLLEGSVYRDLKSWSTIGTYRVIYRRY